MKSIVLFDIDKTLVQHSSAHMKAFIHALDIVYGIRAERGLISHHGMTDQQIIREMCLAKGIDEKTIADGMDRCMKLMVEHFNTLNPVDNIELCPNVVPLLSALQNQGHYLGLVTGNIQEIGWNKLDRAGIKHFFSFGGFGSDDADRRKLAALAVDRCKYKFGLLQNVQVTLIGDTPNDVAAAKAIGARSVAVATGNPSAEILKESGADVVLNDFSDTTAALKAILDL